MAENGRELGWQIFHSNADGMEKITRLETGYQSLNRRFNWIDRSKSFECAEV